MVDTPGYQTVLCRLAETHRSMWISAYVLKHMLHAEGRRRENKSVLHDEHSGYVCKHGSETDTHTYLLDSCIQCC